MKMLERTTRAPRISKRTLPPGFNKDPILTLEPVWRTLISWLHRWNYEHDREFVSFHAVAGILKDSSPPPVAREILVKTIARCMIYGSDFWYDFQIDEFIGPIIALGGREIVIQMRKASDYNSRHRVMLAALSRRL